MKDIFKIDFDFLGHPIQIFIKVYNNEKEVSDFLGNQFAGGGMFYCKGGERHTYIIFNENNYKDVYIYVHEFLHATKFYLSQFGMSDEELECYFLGYLTDTYVTFLETYKQDIKNIMAEDDITE